MARRTRLTPWHGVPAAAAVVGLVALVAVVASSDDAPTATTVPPTIPATAPTADARPDDSTPFEPCPVSDLLVPACGAWLGASTPSRDGLYNYRVGLAEYEAVAQNTPDILHFYKKDGGRFPTAEEISLSERPQTQRSILYYNWKPSTELSWRAVAEGAADANIENVAAGLSAYHHKLFLAIWHEPENDQDAQGTPADYVAMYRHVVERLRAHGVDNVVYVMNFMGFKLWADVVDDFYPGDDVIDWIAYDPYGVGGQEDIGQVLDVVDDDWPGFYTWAARNTDKPLMLAEWGIDLARQPNAPAILAGAADLLQRRYPRLKAFVYWNDYIPPDGVVVRIDEDSRLGQAYGEAYRQMAQSAYFNSTDPGLAP